MDTVTVTAFPISDDGTVAVSAKAYHDLERRIADLEAQAVNDARTIEGLSAQIVHAQMELAAALGHEEADYHANLPDLADEVAQLRQQLAEARAALEKSEREREKWHLDYLGLGQVTDDTYNDIWEIVGDGKGEWDYPAQITRYVGYMRDELVKARQALAGESGEAG